MEQDPTRPLENLPKNWQGGQFLNVPGVGSLLVRVDNGAYEAAVEEREYYSPNQHGGRYGIVYRQYFGAKTNAQSVTATGMTKVIAYCMHVNTGDVIQGALMLDGGNYIYMRISAPNTFTLTAAGLTYTSATSGWFDYVK